MKGLSRQFIITMIVLAIIVGAVVTWNLVKSYLIAKSIAGNQPAVTVSTAKALSQTWHPHLFAVGTLSAVDGISVSTQQAGIIVSVNFESGQFVKKGDLLIQLDDRVEQAQLQNNLAQLKLTEITYLRYKTLLQSGAIARQNFDEAAAKYQQAIASVAESQAIIAHKHITAPFDGKLGIRNVDVGQYIKEGDAIVPLQAMDQLHVDFYLPEKHLFQLYVNQPITLEVDAGPNKTFKAVITAINSLVDLGTHNISVQATIPNKYNQLYPGLFTRIQLILPQQQKVVTVPQTAINYSLYGDTVYVVQKGSQKKDGQAILTVALRVVEIGEQQDNKIVITHGLKAGEEVVTSGQLKLSNGQQVIINNRVQP